MNDIHHRYLWISLKTQPAWADGYLPSHGVRKTESTCSGWLYRNTVSVSAVTCPSTNLTRRTDSDSNDVDWN